MKKVFVIGLDALIPTFVEQFAKDGTCPNLRWCLDNGGFAKLLSAIPAQTPENWTSIATGALPGTHGIAVWGRHNYGDPITERHALEAMSSRQCKSEYLWESIAESGLTSVVYNFVGYPPSTDKAIHIDWLWRPDDYFFEITSNKLYHTGDFKVDPNHPRYYTPEWDHSKKILRKLEFQEATGWTNLPKSYRTPLEAQINLQHRDNGSLVTYNILLLDPNDNGYQECIITKDKDGSKIITKLRKGNWSDWLYEPIEIKNQKQIVTIRFKLIDISKDGKDFLLYQSPVYPNDAIGHPLEIGRELIEKIGPYISEAIADCYLQGFVDEETFEEEITYQIDWIAKSTKYLMEKIDGSLYMMHWHLPDHFSHEVLGFVDPVGALYDPQKAEQAKHMWKKGYQLIDKLVGKFLELTDDDTYLIFVSDHGCAPNRKRFSLAETFAKQGLIVIEENNGIKKVNWKKSKIYIDLTNIYINLKNRYRDGIVEDHEYKPIQDQIIRILRTLTDEDGEFVVQYVMRKEDAPVIGLWGEHVGDVIYTHAPGFSWGMRYHEGGTKTIGGANHGPQSPTTETDISSNYGTFLFLGKDVKKGYIRPGEILGPISPTDIAPTVSHLLNVRPPRHSQGQVLWDFFKGWDITPKKRSSIPLEFPNAPPLFGDVTDRKFKSDSQ